MERAKEARLMAKNPMLQVALDRRQYWRDELLLAESVRDSTRSQKCAKFVAEYDTLIERMLDARKD